MNKRLLLCEFQLADDAWGVLLRGTFGSHAGDARYTKAGQGEPGTALRAAYEAREAAENLFSQFKEGSMVKNVED